MCVKAKTLAAAKLLEQVGSNACCNGLVSERVFEQYRHPLLRVPIRARNV